MTSKSGNTNSGQSPESVPKQKRRYTADSLSLKPAVGNPAAIVDLDLNGFILRWSPLAEQIYGYECDEIVGKHVSSLFCDGELEQGRAAYELHAIHNRNTYNVYGWQKRKSGQQFWTYTEGVRLESGYRLLVVETPKVPDEA